MTDRPPLHIVATPEFVQRMKEEARALERLCIQPALGAVPPGDLERLRRQLTPLAKRPFVAEDRHEYARIIQEWNMRGLPDYAPMMLAELLYDEHHAEREAKATPMRRQFEREFAPWFEPESKPENRAGLHVIPRTSKEDGELIASRADEYLSETPGGSAPRRPDPTATERLADFMRGIAPRR